MATAVHASHREPRARQCQICQQCFRTSEGKGGADWFRCAPHDRAYNRVWYNCTGKMMDELKDLKKKDPAKFRELVLSAASDDARGGALKSLVASFCESFIVSTGVADRSAVELWSEETLSHPGINKGSTRPPPGLAQ